MGAAHALVSLIRARRILLGKRASAKKRLPRQIPPFAVELSYRKEILAYRAIALHMVKQRVFPILGSLLEEARAERGDAERHDASGKRTKDTVDGIRRDMKAATSDERLKTIAEEASARTNQHQKEQLQRQVRSGLGVDVLLTDNGVREQLSTFVEQNVALIKSVPEEMLHRVEQSVLLGVRQNWRADELAEHLQQQVDVSEAKARFIARDQVSKLYGELNSIRQKNLGINGYVWRTVQDERVRPNHAEKEGERFSWDDPPADTGHPGEDFQCRCSAEPILDELLEEEEA